MVLGCAALALASAPQPARAGAPLAVKLEFHAEEGCPTEQEFLKRVTSRADVRLVDDARALRLRVSLATTGNGARGELRAGAEDATDAREVDARSCDEVADALALIATLVVERTKREQATQPTSIAPVTPSPRRVTSAKPGRAPRRLELGLMAIATRPMASTPLTGAGVSLFVPGGVTWWLSAHYSRNDVLAAPHGARLGFGGLVVGAGPPGLRLGSHVQVAAALAVEGAFLTAEGVDVDVTSSAKRSYWAAGALGRIQWEVAHHAWVFTELGGFGPLVERRFSTGEPYELASHTASVALHAALGFALSL
jgi:hypothetical protein